MENETIHIALTLQETSFEDSTYVDRGMKWRASTLCKAAEGLPIFRLPLAGLDLSVMPWRVNNVLATAEHMNRVLKCSLKYPVLLDDYGYICDGWHRVVKALIMQKTHINAKRLYEMPEPDGYIEEAEKS